MTKPSSSYFARSRAAQSFLEHVPGETPLQRQIFLHLCDVGVFGSIPIDTLMARLELPEAVRAPTVRRAIRALSAAGLVSEMRSPYDGRIVLFALSTKGLGFRDTLDAVL